MADAKPDYCGFTVDELKEIVNSYKCRKGIDDDLEYIKNQNANQLIEVGLHVEVDAGLNSDDVADRRRYYGTNAKDIPDPPTFLELLWIALNDFTLIILIICAFVSMAINLTFHEDKSIAWIEGAAILSAVAISSLIAAYNDWEKEKKFVELSIDAQKDLRVIVRRDGQQKAILPGTVVVGDIVIIEPGMEVAGDGYVIDASMVSIDESSLTGESELQKKAVLDRCLELAEKARQDGVEAHNVVPSPILLAGTKVMQGTGAYIVLNVGKNGAIGMIEELCEDSEGEVTPLQMKLETIAENIGTFGLVSAIFTVAFMFIRFGIDLSRSSTGWDGERHPGELVGYVIIGVTIIVVAIPEGLPLAVTLSLAYSVRKMYNEQNFVRRLHACETMGNAQYICTDKTGTLTMNQMTLLNIWSGTENNLQDFVEHKTNKGDHYKNMIPNEELQDIFVNSLALNSTQDANFDHGNASEIALIRYITDCGVNLKYRRGSFRILQRKPHSSSRKRQSIIVEDPSSSTGKRLYMKGGAEIVLGCSTHMNLFNGEGVVEMDDDNRFKILDASNKMGEQALRCIAIAYKDIDDSYIEAEEDEHYVSDYENDGFTFVAICGIKDALRKGVKEAIDECTKAGVKVRMVTGDNMVTAKAIAKACGIWDNKKGEEQCMDGAKFWKEIGGVVDKPQELKDAVGLEKDIQEEEAGPKEDDHKTIGKPEAFKRIAVNLTVLARSRPEDKHALVTGLKDLGYVVAVTGDGTNDAPALSKADVGFAMNIAGTDVAKNASDIVILDDNFASIVTAIVWGRNIYDSIRKFLQFQLTVNIVAVVGVFIGAVILRQAIVNAVQMLWINLIMDCLASLALATETPNKDLLLDRKPQHRRDSIVSKKMFKHVVGHSLVQLVIVLWIVFVGDSFLPWGRDDGQANPDGTVISGRYFFVRTGEEDYIALEPELGPSAHFTYVFNIFVWLQIFNFVNARKINDEVNVLEGLGRSPLFLILLVVIMVLQWLFITFGDRAIGCVTGGLDKDGWIITLIISSISLPVSLVLKFLPEEALCPFNWGNVETDPLKNYEGTVTGMRRGSSRIKRFNSQIPKASIKK